MNKKQVFEKLKKMEPIPDDAYEYIKKHSFVTGSSVFGGFTNESDIDLVFFNVEKHPRMLFDKCIATKWALYSIEDYNGAHYLSVYFSTKDGTVYNVLEMNKKGDFTYWKKATNTMVKLCKIPIIRKSMRNKRNRVDLFELLRRFYGDPNV